MTYKIKFNNNSALVYEHLEPIVDALLEDGNELVSQERWAENRDQYYCALKNPINYDLVAEQFELPKCVKLNRGKGSIDCDITWASIKGCY